MAENSKIEWTDSTWNPIGGCTRVDEGCRNCYAEIMAARFSGPGQWGEGLARIVGADGARDHRWTGKMRLNETALDRPIRWRSPRRIFVNSTSDLFHESVPDEWIDRVFAVMALCPQHTFQVLTKRPERARHHLQKLTDDGAADRLSAEAGAWFGDEADVFVANWINGWSCPVGAPSDKNPCNGSVRRWPLPNVWLGTSIHDQASADKRIPELLSCPAAVRFVSAEPLLGPVDLTRVGSIDSVRSAFPDLVQRLDRHMRPHIISGAQIEALGSPFQATTYFQTPDHMGGFEVGSRYYPRLDLVIVGGESGPHARVWQGFEDAARSLRDQCRSAGVAFFMKQMAGARKSSMPPIPDDLMVREMPGVQHG